MAQPFYSPYLYYQTSMSNPFVARGEGVYLWDHDGKQYLDGSSGAIICNIGHGDQRILDAITEQAKQTFFCYRTQFENEPAHRLAKKLVDNSAPHLNRVFYVSSGSEAVESALKLCQQYYYARRDSRNLIISRFPSYHGATIGALSLTAYAVLENPYRQLLRAHPRIPAPYCYRCEYNETYPKCGLRCAWALEQCILDYGKRNIAAFIAEPITGASGGAIVPPPDYFDVIQQICRKYEIIFILDEVMTGYGRTGRLFGYEHWNVTADIIALSKGMGAGYFPLAATISRREIVDAVMADGGFKHGHTSAGAPMACAVGERILDVILEDKLCENAAAMGLKLGEGLRQLAEKHEIIGDVRGIGLLWAVEFVADRETKAPFPAQWSVGSLLTAEAFDEGLIVYPRRSINGARGDHVLVAPPLIVTPEQVDELLEKLERSLVRLEELLARMSMRSQPC